tara:strand:+ start:723 stop:866 length:144 start_codon:yes stop_codon:yes gene_type:complete
MNGKEGKIEKYNPKDTAINRPMNKKGHGSIMAGKAIVRKSKKIKRTK